MRDLKMTCVIDRTTELEVEYSQIKNVAIFYAASNDAQLTSVAMGKLQVEALIKWLGEALAVMESSK